MRVGLCASGRANKFKGLLQRGIVGIAQVCKTLNAIDSKLVVLVVVVIEDIASP